MKAIGEFCARGIRGDLFAEDLNLQVIRQSYLYTAVNQKLFLLG